MSAGQRAYEHAACALVTCSAAGQVLECNATMRRWLGRADDAPPASMYDFLAPASLLFFEMQLRPLLALGRTVDGAFVTLRRADGSDLPVVVNAVQPTGSGLIDLAMVGVREREQYESQLRDAQRDAEAALRALTASAHAHKMQAVGQMAAGVAHEFNNLLAVVRGNLGFAQQTMDDGVTPSATGLRQVAQDIASALTATDRAIGIVQQLLAFTGRQIVRRAPLDVNEVVAQGARLLQPALGRDVTWQTRLADELPPVFAARDQLEHVVAELVLNARDAIKAMDRPGLIVVSTALVAHPTGDPTLTGVRLEVSDTGCGMDEETQRRAIDPFFSTKGPGRGTGLGLSMVYGAVSALGGTTRITSAPGRGTQVIIDLPAAVAA